MPLQGNGSQSKQLKTVGGKLGFTQKTPNSEFQEVALLAIAKIKGPLTITKNNTIH